jgi:predicted ArsR family transcriptional regulator
MSYPHTPGWKGTATSHAAARAVAGKSCRLRLGIVKLLLDGQARTADQIAAEMGCEFITIRPRMSELRNQGAVMPCGRGKSFFGKSACLWTLTPLAKEVFE